ncbi:MAG: T9SS type A sorting domain-containing protein [Ignavibacteriaceae bacterium]|nr:T9SS type A sorting domain-containing protein [Ignavibacteriaceae bacterium]
MKPRIIFLYFFLITFIFCLEATATIRYVSKTGSNTPPYTSWLTASDSIQKCINICQSGDTVYVANGVYKEKIVMIPGLSLIGSGMDSCVIDTRGIMGSAIQGEDNCCISGFNIQSDTNGDCISLYKFNGLPLSGKIENNKFTNGIYGISSQNSDFHISNNIFCTAYGIFLALGKNTIIKNYFYVTSIAIDCNINTSPSILNNMIVINNNSSGAYGYDGGFGIRGDIVSNCFVILNADAAIAAWSREYIYNNLIIGNYKYGIITQNGDSVKNNIITNGQTGLWFSGTADTSIIRYNNLWNNQINYRSYNPDSTNLYKDPMFVNDTSDYRLQKFSLMIDSGDPGIIDKDSTRSDIGLYGGPYGESYTYQDLAPKQPRNLLAILDTDKITLKWNKNTEADTSFYNIYRDTLQNFVLDSTKLIGSTVDTSFVQSIPSGINKYLYKVTCTDNQGNESVPSEEIEVNLTSINDYPVTINNYVLYQNYPNPFNPSTIIGYKLKESGYVKLIVYNLNGELVKILINEIQETGYHEVEFIAEGLASGIYLYKIYVKGDNNIPKFTEINKMILIK